MQFQILTRDPTYKMSRWTMIKWVFRGIAFVLTALMVSIIITLWSQPDTSSNESVAPKPQQQQQTIAPSEPISHQSAQKQRF
ncbi:MAG: hypothetical protein RLZZ628_729 [Bacteroidota bacterium]|jgi:hypothetical protein